MSISDENVEVGVEVGGQEPELEFVALEDGQEPPREEVKEEPKAGALGVQLTPEQLEALVSKAGGGQVALEGLERLAQSVRTPVQQVQAQVQAPLVGEAFEKELFTPGNTEAALKRFLQEQLAPVQAQQNQVLIAQNRELLRLRPDTAPYFKKYEREIETMVQNAPAHVRSQPNVYELAYQAMMQNKQNEIVEDRAREMAEKLVAEALEKAGVKGAPKGPALQMEAQGGAVGKPKTKQTVYITKADVKDMVERGLNPNDPEQTKFYWEKYVKGRK